ncbi:PadR family transcriptional regulator [Ruania zhangjianzhongii]|uniref:PadR family transcriptional regulator n=1 Tax=Ruania zhangjianzhongii TaxID=2603206 RepID=UPI0011CC71B9|nr:PadR family transcriptional regulator [Ruania zhangjianzhongii]
MSVKQGLLALLSEEPMGVARLRKQFEARTGGTWPLNIGQVYTTVRRLERDGLVAYASDETAETDVDRYLLTDEGRAEADGWWQTPVRRGAPERDELVIKVALAATAPGVSVRDVVQRQRTETMRALRDLTKLAARIDPASPADLSWSLVLDNHIFTAEAELRWLDHIESRAERAAHAATDPSTASAEAPKAARTGRAKSRSRR